MTTAQLQQAKKAIKELQSRMEDCETENLPKVIRSQVGNDYFWRGMHPFYEQHGADSVAEVFWQPLYHSLKHLQRREDVFMAGFNDVDAGKSIWVASMGHFMGLFDEDWLGIPATGKMAFLRYAEFHRVENKTITESALFCDVISVMQQAGHNPLPPQTGAAVIHPGPRTHDGVLLDPQPEAEGEKTMTLVNNMVQDLSQLNETSTDRCPPELLAKSWHDDMIWYGPAGIGATYTIPRYQKQHQHPFREQLKDKTI